MHGLAAAAALFAAAAAANEVLGAAPDSAVQTQVATDGAVEEPSLTESQRLALFEASLDGAFATGDFVGLAVAVVRSGETAFIRTYGVTEIGSAAPVTPDTVFRIASLSKGFAATLAAIAVQEGKLDLNAPVGQFAPEYRLPAGGEKTATLEHLLSHRTGLTPNSYDNLLEAGVPIAQILPKYATAPTLCKVGACYSYQNISFDLAGRAVSSAYGEPYEAVAARRLFDALGMKSASFGETSLVKTGDWARPHVRDRAPKGFEGPRPWRSTTVRPPYYRVPAAGGANASISDMAAWLNAQMGHAPGVVPHEALALAHAPRIVTPAETVRARHVANRFARSHYGLGWRIYDYAGRRVIAHAGSVDGYAAQIAWLPDEDVGIVLLSNARSARMWRILPTFLDIELGLLREDWLGLEEDVSPPATLR